MSLSYGLRTDINQTSYIWIDVAEHAKVHSVFQITSVGPPVLANGTTHDYRLGADDTGRRDFDTGAMLTNQIILDGSSTVPDHYDNVE